MKQGLKKKLVAYIKEQGYISYSQLEDYCHIWKYKTETATRRLRQAVEEGEDIEAVYGDKHYIKGYRRKGKEVQMKLL